MIWLRHQVTLEPRPRGFHVITNELVGQLEGLERIRIGLLHVLIAHTSASLSLNENASPAVRRDLSTWFDAAVPESASLWTHTLEGPDDMPAHLKASLLGASLLLPLSDGRPLLGTWQGIYLCEHRDRGGARTLICTAFGEG